MGKSALNLLRWGLLIIAGICSAVSFPAMVIYERRLPHLDRMADAWERLGDGQGSIFHDLKNLSTEAVRSDAQWWSKALWFAVVISVGAALIF